MSFGFNTKPSNPRQDARMFKASSSYTPQPSGPAGQLWGLNHLRAMQPDYLGFVQALHHQHPDIAQIQVFNERITHVFRPDWMREILVDQADALIRWERATEVFSLSMGQSVLVTEGAQWQRQRRMLQPGFAPKRVAAYAGLMSAATRKALDDLTLTLPNAGAEVDVEALMTRTTLDVILRALFDRHQVTNAESVAQAIQTLSHYGFKQFFKRFSWPLWMPLPAERQAKGARKILNDVIAEHIQIAKAESKNDGEDLLTMLRLARDPERPEQGLSAQELHDQAMVIFQAGHETSATALTWWCGLIAQHPDVAERICNEVDSILQGEDPTPATLQQMPWLQASLKEALRLYPPAAILFTRRAQRDITVGPWTLPRGSLMAFTPYVVQRDARWFNEPDAFMPERFLPGAPEAPRRAWMAFGTGPRVCIGQHFAQLEMGLIAAMLLQRFSLQRPNGRTWPIGKLAVTLRPDQGMLVNLVPRQLQRAA